MTTCSLFLSNMVRDVPAAGSIDRIAYRPKGKNHPAQWRAVFANGRQMDVTAESADRVLWEAKCSGLYDGLVRHPWAVRMDASGGRQWWAYKLLDNDLGHLLEEIR